MAPRPASPRFPGIFITFEGTEGAGKSTLIRALAVGLERRGFSVALTREPGGSKVAEALREVILEQAMAPWTEVFLYEAARAEHLDQTVFPELTLGKIVLCDRYTDSTLAYQGMARGLDWKTIRTLNGLATRGLQPDATIFLDIDPEEGLRSASDPNRFEAEGVAFQTRVRKGFLKIRREEPRRFLTVQARSGSPEEMADALLARLEKKFAKRLKKLAPAALPGRTAGKPARRGARK